MRRGLPKRLTMRAMTQIRVWSLMKMQWNLRCVHDRTLPHCVESMTDCRRLCHVMSFELACCRGWRRAFVQR